jgi:hypothetical protein
VTVVPWRLTAAGGNRTVVNRAGGRRKAARQGREGTVLSVIS